MKRRKTDKKDLQEEIWKVKKQPRKKERKKERKTDNNEKKKD